MSGKTFPTINPATGEKLTDVQEAAAVRHLNQIHFMALKIFNY